MTTTEWHAPADQLTAFRAGRLTGAAAASVETHLLGCDHCRRTLSAMAAADPAPRQAAMWAAISDAVDEPSRSSRLSTRWVRLTLGSPTLRLVTVALVLAVLVPPLVATAVSGRAGWVLLFVLAPLAPVAAAVVAYRPEIDPAGSLAAATPLASLQLVLLRALVVLGIAVPVGLLTSMLLPARTTLLVGWLLPGLALCSIVMVAGTRVEPTRLAIGLSVAWSATVLGTGARVWRLPADEALDDLFVNQAVVQQLSVAVIVVAALLLATRRNTLTTWSAA